MSRYMSRYLQGVCFVSVCFFGLFKGGKVSFRYFWTTTGMDFFSNNILNQLEKLEAAKTASLVCISLT